MTDRPDTWRSGAPPAAFPDLDNGPEAERVFPWGPWMTLALLLFIGIVTLTVIMIASVAIVGVDYLQQDGDVSDARGRSFIEFFLSKVSGLLLPLTILQTITAVAMVVLFTIRGLDGPTRWQMLALEPIPVWTCVKWTGVTMVAVIAISELPRLVFDLGHDDALEWLKQMQPVWLAMVLLVVLAPLSEELLFRGFVYAGLAQSRIGPIGAILVASGIWSLIHVQYDWPVLVQVFIFGIVFGIVRWRSGSLWPPIIAHGIVNLFAGLSIYGRDWTLV